MSLGTAVDHATRRVLEPVEAMHRVSSRPWLAAAGPFQAVASRGHSLMLDTVYGAIRAGSSVLGAVLDHRVGESAASESAVAVVSGLWGDDLGRDEERLGTPMSLHFAADPVVGERVIGERLIVYVHGFAQTDRTWRTNSDERSSFIDALAGDDVTQLLLRYNTGRSVDTNGRELSSLLEEIRIGWPRPIASLSLVGYSLGGVVIRSACADAQKRDRAWLPLVDHVVTIGSPHRGTPLEKLAHAATIGLGLSRYTTPLSAFLDSRSQGIKDLRHGTVLDPIHDTIDLVAEYGGSQLFPGINWHFVAGSFTSDPTHPVAAVVGDLVVRPTSSTTSPRIEPTNVHVIGGVHHLDLLHEPAVINAVADWLSCVEGSKVS